jgi:hypothetical protein
VRRLTASLIVAACLAPLVPLTADEPSFIVAVVRDDGVMLPVATFDRGRWRTPWPGPAREAEVPVRLEDCPLAWWGLPQAPRDWTLHVAGESPQRIAVDGVTWVLSHCQQQVSVFSRAARRPLPRPADGLRAPKHGLALAGDGSVTLPRALALDGAEAAGLLDTLQPVFNREERLMLAGDAFENYTPPVPARMRDRMPVRALALHEGPGRDGPVYFVELERRYPRKMPERLQWCDEVTYMTGWAHRGRDGSLDLSLITRGVTSCLLDTVVRAAPLGVLGTDAGPVWLVEEYRPEAEAFGLYLAPGRDDAKLITRRFGGSCVP